MASYEPRRIGRSSHWQPGEEIPVLPPGASPLSSSNSFDSSLEEEPSYNSAPRTDYEKLWEDVQSLIRVSFDSFEGKWLDLTCRLQQMEERLNGLQTLVTEQHSECPSSSDSSTSTSSRKRKRKTPVTLQVHVRVHADMV